MDANKTAGEEARRQLHENAASNLEQVLAATHQKTPTIRTQPLPGRNCVSFYRSGLISIWSKAKSRWQHPTRHQIYGHLPPITKTIQVRRTRHAGHCWRSKDELISDVLLWTPTYGRAKAGRPPRIYIQQLCEDTEYSLEDLLEVMNAREKWWERVRDIRARGMTWWWWWLI